MQTVNAQTAPPPHWMSNIELYVAAGSGLLWMLGLLLPFLGLLVSSMANYFFWLAVLLGGFFPLKEAIEDLQDRKLTIDFLMIVAAAGAGVLGNWAEAALLLFLFSLGHALEHYAMGRARKSIEALSQLAPPTAVVLRGKDLVEVAVEDLAIGDRMLVKPNSKIAADGVVVAGHSSVDQSPITGESIPVEKEAVGEAQPRHVFSQLAAENKVFAGTLNGSSALEVEVLCLHQDSTLAKLVELVQHAEKQKSPTQHFAERFERRFVPLVLLLVSSLLLAFLVLEETFTQSFYRAMSVLVAASPCALAISTPSAVLAGVARAARQGVLIKGGKPLEELGSLQALAFDKTGTLTQGKPSLTSFEVLGEHERLGALAIAIAVEEQSDHPLSRAIVSGGKAELPVAFPLPSADDIQALTARGIQASIGGEPIYIGNRRLFEEVNGVPIPETIEARMRTLEMEGKTVMLMGRQADFIALIAVMDKARPEAAATLKALKEIGIKRLIMLTGDHQLVADAIAHEIGITDPFGSLLPEDKVAAIQQLIAEEGKAAMVGDGVNDAPAMASSTVGIAMGAAGSEVALQTADIALMGDDLRNLPFAIKLSRKANRIIRQNIWISLGMIAVLVPLTIFGIANLGPAVAAHEGSTMVVVLNALRLLRE